jgi:hypothetical protein
MTMRKINYTIIPSVGPEEEQAKSTVLDLLKDSPYVLGQFIPPLIVLNNILESGVMDAGMSGGCTWKPFQLDATEYDELVEVLKKEGLKAIEPPEWVTTYAYWKIWELEQIAGVPSCEHKRLHDLHNHLEEEHRIAIEEGRQADAEQIQQKLFDAGNRLADFVNCHIKRCR